MSAAAISADDASADSALASAAKPSGDFAALVSHATEQLAANSHISPAANPRHMAAGDAAMHMEHPVGHADWSNELGNKLNWMATAQRQQADLVLNPPQLGRVEISLTVTGDQATAVFASASAEVRELLEDSLPRLREILSGAGINLGEAEVGAESSNRFGTQDQPGDNGPGTRGRTLPGNDMGMIAIPSAGMTGGRGMVDIFA
jgi:flagellar hook-length control protein FliK